MASFDLIPTLVDMLSSLSSGEQKQAAAALAALLENNRACAVLRRWHHAWAAAAAVAVTISCWPLRMINAEDHRAAVVRAGGIAPLSRLLAQGGACGTQLHAARALGLLAEGAIRRAARVHRRCVTTLAPLLVCCLCRCHNGRYHRERWSAASCCHYRFWN